MMRFCILIWIALITFFHSIDAADSPISQIYLGSRESDPHSLVENVSTIHGDYTEIEVDVTVPSPDSLVLSRFYSSNDTLHIATFGGWRFTPQCFLTMQKDPCGKSYSTREGTFERTLVYTGNPDGTILTYVGWKNTTNCTKRTVFKIDAQTECKGICNTAKGDIGIWTNLKNNELYYDPQDDSFELSLCTEGKRFYVKNPAHNLYRITHEILPSGNKIFYEFTNDNQLALIKETNASEKKVLAWIKITYGNSIHLETSDGKTVDYHFQQDPSGAKLLTSVKRSHKPHLDYQYHVIDTHALLIKKALPEGRFVAVDYYTDTENRHKVQTITTPGTFTGNAITRFIYENGYTEVHGPGPCKAIYRFDENQQLIAFEQYLNGSLYKILRKSWGKRSDAGNLLCTSLADASGNIFYHKYLVYDRANNGNIVEEREYGDIAGTGSIVLEVDDEGCVGNHDGSIKNFSYFSGKTTHGFFQKDSKGTGVKYWYKKGTNLLIKKFVLMKGSKDSEDEDYNSGIKQRFFYTYNDDAVVTKVTIDDGKEPDGKNFYGIKERMITYISPKQEMPNVGSCAVIEQKYSSPEGKSEFLLQKAIHHFDSEGNISAQEIFDANNEYRYTITKNYAQGLLLSETDPLGNETRYSYDANQNRISEVHSDTGLSIEYLYDLKNRLVHTIEKDVSGNQFESEIAYDAAGYKSAEKDHFGNLTIYENDSLGRTIRVTYPDTTAHSSVTYVYEYDLFDNPISITRPDGKVIKTRYNVKNNPSQIEYLDGTKDIFRYDSGGNIHHHYCRNGIVQVFEYDYIGRPSKVQYYCKGTDPSKNYAFTDASCEYSTFHKTSETDPRGKKTFYTYDGAGRLSGLKKEHQKVDFTYDALGRMNSAKKWKSSQDFTLEIRDYDLFGRVIEERTEDSSGQILLQKKFTYDNAGNLFQIIGYPKNEETVLMEYEYDGFGRVTKTINAFGNVHTIMYDNTCIDNWGKRAHKKTTIDPMGNSTEEIFDNEDHLTHVCKKDINGKILSSVDTPYDHFGNILEEKATVISSQGQSADFTIEYSYASSDLLESIVMGKSSLLERKTRFEYNMYGELSKKCNPETQAPILYRFDLRGNLEKVSYKEGKNDVEYRMYYDYNKNLTSISRDALSINYIYDDNDLCTCETVKDDFGSYQISRTYDGEGKITSLKFPDGSSVEYSYKGPFVKSASRFDTNKKELYTYVVSSRDMMGNIEEEILPGHLGKRTQTWDAEGRRVRIANELFQDEILDYDALDTITKKETFFEKESFITEYEYNSLLQLISEKGGFEHTYSYDSVGNRRKKDRHLYKVNNLNELIETEKSSYTYDLNGNITTKIVNGKTWTYQNNALNQIVSIKDDQTTLNYTYDLTGKRFSKRFVSKCKKKIQRFFYIDDTEIGCVDEKGEIVELKIPSDPNNPQSPAIAFEMKKEVYVPLYDLQGNVSCLLDPVQRRLLESYRYSAYGEEKILNSNGQFVTDSSIGNPWRFKDKRIDSESSLIYFGFRYYDPEIGRFISPDPMGSIDGVNLYAFVHNNPIKYRDYFGYNSQLDPNCGCVLHGHPGWYNAPHDCVCICGRDGKNEAPANNYRSRMGSGIKSVLGGIGHGAVDFAIGSIHDLQTAAAYIGSSELDMSLHERIDMIEAIEQSQMRQLTTVSDLLMDAMGIDEHDALYQACRSTTTIGLEVASFVAGGYEAIKGISSLRKLARMPVNASKALAKAAYNSTSSYQAKLLKMHLKQIEEYGAGSYRRFSTGRIRYYGEIDLAKTKGEMRGRRLVREWDPKSGMKRTWHETLDNNGNVRIVRPETNDGNKTHYLFDSNGNYVGVR